MRPVKVLLVIENSTMTATIVRILEKDHRIRILAHATDAYSARDKIIECKPEVMVLCNDLPKMRGIDFLKKLMPQYPQKVLFIGPEELEEEAYHEGAEDFICFSDEETEYKLLEAEKINERLIQIVYPDFEEMQQAEVTKKVQLPPIPKSNISKQIIAIGASTGGTDAIAQVLREMKKDVPGIVIVQHMPEGFTQLYAQRLDAECELSVKEAKSGDIVQRGHVLLAPGDKQMKVVKVNNTYQVECRNGPRVSGHCPSVDVLFESVARVAGENAIGVLLTGMGKDGANGLLTMRNAGAYTIGQDEKSCVVYGMPKEAYDLGAVCTQLPLDGITKKIYSYLQKNR